jgi:Ribonuclease R winged-helix domain
LRFARLSLVGIRSSSHPIMISEGIMDTSLERIRAKIAELETKLADLRIAERELLALEKFPVRKTRTSPGPEPKRKPGASDQEEVRHTIGAAIADVLGQHGALSAAEIADYIRATGRDINNRAVSYSLQALKKRGLVRSADGRWTLPKARFRRTRS